MTLPPPRFPKSEESFGNLEELLVLAVVTLVDHVFYFATHVVPIPCALCLGQAEDCLVSWVGVQFRRYGLR